MAEAPKISRRSYRMPILGFLVFVALPTLAAAWYYFQIHADRYVSEFRYSVRGGAMLQTSGESGLATGGAAALVFAADSFVLEDYLASVQAFEDVERRLPLREMLAKDGGDPLRRFDPTLPSEDLLPFWERAVQVRFDAITGITTANVSFYTPEDAKAVAEALVSELQDLVNGLSEEARNEMLDYVNGQYADAKASLDIAREDIAEFRRKNRIFSPEETVTIEGEISKELSTQLSAKRVEMRTLLQRAPNSPRIAILADEIEALVEQLLAQYAGREAGGGGGKTMAAQLATYQALQENYEIARQTYATTYALQQEAKANATLNQAQLVVFVKPRLPQKSIDPDRPYNVLVFFGFAFLIWVVARIFLAGFSTQ